jgi:hypothetical protein
MLESIGAICGIVGIWLFLFNHKNRAVGPLLAVALLFLFIGSYVDRS